VGRVAELKRWSLEKVVEMIEEYLRRKEVRNLKPLLPDWNKNLGETMLPP
jgi:hypothetical protein